MRAERRRQARNEEEGWFVWEWEVGAGIGEMFRFSGTCKKHEMALCKEQAGECIIEWARNKRKEESRARPGGRPDTARSGSVHQ